MVRMWAAGTEAWIKARHLRVDLGSWGRGFVEEQLGGYIFGYAIC